MLTYFLIAVALSMDAFAVSVSSGICIPHMKWRYALRAALAFGFFQFFMPVLGWAGGLTFRTLIQNVDHWLAFFLLLLVGGHMIKESFDSEEKFECACAAEGIESVEACQKKRSILDCWGLLILAVATSLDALAVGLSYSCLNKPILLPSVIIGLVTFFVSLMGCEFGKKLGAKFGKWAELGGGLVLVGIGLKILMEHLKCRI